MPENLDYLLARAQQELDRGNEQEATSILRSILEQDYFHRGTWALLHQKYGANHSFNSFQRAFTQKYFPEKYPLIAADGMEGSENSSDPFQAIKGFTGALTDRGSGVKDAFSGFVGRFRRKQPAQHSARERRILTELPPEPAPEQGQQQTPDPQSSSAPKVSQSPKQERRSEISPREPLRHVQPFVNPENSPYEHIEEPNAKPGRFFDRGSMSRPASFPYSRPSLNGAAGRQDIRVMIVDDNQQTRENIIRSLSFESDINIVAQAASGEESILKAAESLPDVVLMDVNMPDMDGITATIAIRQKNPTIQVIILTVQDDPDYMRKAMRAGARDFLIKPPGIDELVHAVKQAAEHAKREKNRQQSAEAGQSQAALQPQGKVITIYSPKGGVGCTTIAANLAAALESDDTPVVLVDADLQFGDTMVLFNQQSKHTILDLTSQAVELDPHLLEEVLVRHTSGVWLLSPPRPEQAESVKPDRLGDILDYLRMIYAYIIVDTASEINNTAVATFERSDLVLLVTTQDIPSVANLRKFYDLAPLLSINRERILLVMNKYDKRVAITPEKISESWQKDFGCVIPLDEATVIPSTNRGAPFMLQSEQLSKPISRAFLGLTETIRAQINRLETKVDDEEKDVYSKASSKT